jgi:hypothetical protein
MQKFRIGKRKNINKYRALKSLRFFSAFENDKKVNKNQLDSCLP